MAEEEKWQAPFGELLRLQQDFQARLADETLRYLRRLHGAMAPITPGTVLVPGKGVDLDAQAVPGGTFEMVVDIHNYQRVHAAAAPSLDPLVASSGTTWYPEADFSPEFSLVAPDEDVKFLVRVRVPAELPAGTYVGALSFRGFRQSAFRLSVTVAPADGAATVAVAKKTTRRKASASMRQRKTRKAKQS